jgi:hypothetical protein
MSSLENALAASKAQIPYMAVGYAALHAQTFHYSDESNRTVKVALTALNYFVAGLAWVLLSGVHFAHRKIIAHNLDKTFSDPSLDAQHIAKLITSYPRLITDFQFNEFIWCFSDKVPFVQPLLDALKSKDETGNPLVLVGGAKIITPLIFQIIPDDNKQDFVLQLGEIIKGKDAESCALICHSEIRKLALCVLNKSSQQAVTPFAMKLAEALVEANPKIVFYGCFPPKGPEGQIEEESFVGEIFKMLPDDQSKIAFAMKLAEALSYVKDPKLLNDLMKTAKFIYNRIPVSGRATFEAKLCKDIRDRPWKLSIIP